ncbi:MAG: peptide transporter permease [Vampirovibrio sp.]|jgi:oligopeptide transport system permease protein|nr:peptide transporter permease [Vampirovibrio sp.]
MPSLILRRLLAGLLTLFVVISLTFMLLRLMPGGPFDQERKVPPAIKANIEARYHLNEPLWKQYAIYMGGVLRGDLGPSYKYKSRSVTDIVGEATMTSGSLGLMALMVGTVFGVLLGALAGLSRNRAVDGLLTLLGVASISTPLFIFGGFLVLIFSLTLNWLPAAMLETPKHYILPVLSLSLMPFSYAFLLTRTTVRETRSKQYVLIKRSEGLSESVIAVRHILRNSLIPLVSILGPMAAAIITGSFAVEYIFAIPGLGKHFVTAVTNRDYTLVMGITIIYGVALIVFNTLTDILYGLLDPRLREESKA